MVAATAIEVAKKNRPMLHVKYIFSFSGYPATSFQYNESECFYKVIPVFF